MALQKQQTYSSLTESKLIDLGASDVVVAFGMGIGEDIMYFYNKKYCFAIVMQLWVLFVDIQNVEHFIGVFDCEERARSVLQKLECKGHYQSIKLNQVSPIDKDITTTYATLQSIIRDKLGRSSTSSF
jgi:hypothetical protein